MAANPFRKSEFHSYREWEEALVFFLLGQLRKPEVAEWEALLDDVESRVNLAQTSLFLSNFAYAAHLESEQTLRTVFPALTGRKPTADDVNAWTAKKWVNVERLNHALKYAWKNRLSPETHHLVA